MKFRINSIYSLFFIGLIGYICIARTSNPPNGRTNAPGDGFCTDCHSGGAGIDGTIAISGLPATVMADQTYTLTFTTNNPNGNANIGGFQMVALDAANDNVGTLANNVGSTALETSGGRTYLEHRPAQNFPATNNIAWTVDWTAPAGPNNETITFYAASLFGNGNGDDDGDLSVANTFSTTLMAAPDPPVVGIVKTDVTCSGANDGTASATVTGGVMPYSFAWSNGEATQSIDNLSPGMYSVVVTDGNMETGTATTTINEPNQINTATTVTAVDCNGNSTGAIDLMVSGGNGSFSFLWSNGATTEDLSNIPAGTYSVAITDAPNCTINVTDILVGEPTELTLNIDVVDVDCNGNNNGEIVCTPSGGSGPYDIDWSNGSSGMNNSNLAPGFYSVMVSDANNCTASIQDIEIVEPDILEANPSSTNETAAGAADGTATASPVGGTSPYDYEWSTGEMTAMITGLAAGTYSVTVTDDNQCMHIDSVTIQVGACNISATLMSLPASCNNTANGSAVVNVSGAVGSISYIWSNGDTTSGINNVLPGWYSVTASDEANCFVLDSIEIMIQDTESPIAIGKDLDLVIGGSGTVIANPQDFNNGSSDNCNGDLFFTASPQIFTCNNLGMNEVVFTVSDASGNIDTDTVMVNVTSDLMVTVDSVVHESSGNDGAIFITVTGGSGDFTFEWMIQDAIISNSEDPSALAQGFYELKLTDTTGCMITLDSVEVKGSVGFSDPVLDQNISVFPNPASQQIQIENKRLEDGLRFELLSLEGERIQNGLLQNRTTAISVTELNQGMYFIRIYNGDRFTVRKLIVN